MDAFLFLIKLLWGSIVILDVGRGLNDRSVDLIYSILY